MHAISVMFWSSQVTFIYTELYTTKKQRHSNKQENSVDETNYISAVNLLQCSINYFQ